MIKPEAIPQFTGDLGQLEKDYAGLKADAGHIRDTGSSVHTQFQGLSAYYIAPEAEKLFDSTKPVQDRADTFGDDLEKVSTALSDYATEVRPLVTKLAQLKTDATNFVNKVKDDDDWEYDEDKIDEHNQLRDDVTATVAAFWAAERTCHNKITALFGGTQMVAGDGSDRKDQYGFNADDLKNAKLPWGDPMEEKHHAWEVGHWVKSFVWDGLIVDGIWGTIKGLGTLVGFGGWDAMGQAWKGLAQLATGLVITAIPGAGTLFWALPDDKLPSWLRDSRTAMKETGKALVAWDEWGKNPGRAAGAVTFNVLTTVFTGGAGGAAAGAGKAGAVAKALSVAGKAGKVIDPMTYIAKGAGAGISKIGDIAKGLKGIGNVEIPKLPDDAIVLPEGSIHLPDGAVHLPDGAAIPDGAVKLPDGTIKLPDDVPVLPEGATKLPTEPGAPAQYFDHDGNLLNEHGDIVQKASDARPEGSPDINPDTGADTPHTGSPSPDRQPALVGAGAHTADNTAHVGAHTSDNVIHLGDSLGNDLGDIGRTGDNLPGTNIGDNLPGGNAGNHLPGGGAGDHVPTGHVGDSMPGSHVGDNMPVAHAGDNLPSNSLDSATPGTHVGDDFPGPRAETPTAGGHPGGHDLPGGHADDALPGHPDTPASGGLDDLGHAGDDTVGDGPDAAARPDSNAPGGSADVERPSFMRDGDNPYGPRGSLTDEQIMEIQRYRANHEPGYFEDFYKSNGNRKNLNLFDESGRTPPQLTRASENHPWVGVKDAPEPLKPNYVGDWDKKGAADVTSPARLKTLDEAALKRHLAIRHDKLMEAWKQETATAHELLDTVESKAHNGESVGAYKESHSVMRDAAEDFGETAAEHHFIAERHPGAVREPLDGPANGNDQFDQVWRRKDGGYVVIEAKSSVTTELGARNLPSGRRVSQGTREYFLDIIAEMRKRGESNIDELLLADKLDAALDAGKLDYVVVKGEKNAGTYAGYHMRQFDIAERSTP